MNNEQLTMLITGFSILTMNIVNTILTRNAGKKTDQVKAVSETLVRKADEIHVLTNSSNTQLQLQLATAMEKISGLEKLAATQAELVRLREIPGPPGPQGEKGEQGEKGPRGKGLIG